MRNREIQITLTSTFAPKGRPRPSPPKLSRLMSVSVAAACVLALAGCASRGDLGMGSDNDPLERVNRAVFSFNDGLDRNVLAPLASGYSRVVPEPVRDGIRGVIYNIGLPITFVNDLLQLKSVRAGETLARFTVNSTVGLAGLWDPATKFHIPNHSEDFGQTLAFYGVGEGPYLVLPLLGPAPARDLAGRVSDFFFDPLTYGGLREAYAWQAGRDTVSGVDLRSRAGDEIDAVRDSSVDFYAMTRGIYRQYREAEIRDESAAEDLPDF
jgi:phospholipid-binding lipoprotein MlaA